MQSRYVRESATAVRLREWNQQHLDCPSSFYAISIMPQAYTLVVHLQGQSILELVLYSGIARFSLRKHDFRIK